MEKAFPCILLLLSWATASSKYVYVANKVTWFEARQHCRQHYTDLAPVGNANDNQRLQMEMKSDHSWIGLQRDAKCRTDWMWSGGTEVRKFYWGSTQPDNHSGEDYGALYNNGWHDNRYNSEATFFCYNPIVVEERKTWEEALQYCRQRHRDLASLLSETEMILVGKALLKANIAAHVWIGLHFFAGEWLWVDGETSEYKAWGGQGEAACPNPKQVCTALRMKSIVAHPENDEASSDCAVAVPGEWEARSCDESLPFICY